jgi:hypothetical protein
MAAALGMCSLVSIRIYLHFNSHVTAYLYPPGIPAGDDEADSYLGTEYGAGNNFKHFYSSAGEMYRGFYELGAVWQRIGKSANRTDVVRHGALLAATAPKILAALQVSLQKTTVETGDPAAPRCIATNGDPFEGTANRRAKERTGAQETKVEVEEIKSEIMAGQYARAPLLPELNKQLEQAEKRDSAATSAAESATAQACSQDTNFRAYPEMLYSGVLSEQQVDDIYRWGSNGTGGRFLTLGCPGYNHKQTTYTAYGWAYGLLVHDMVERFLLHFYAMAAHTYTRGTWTTPEVTPYLVLFTPNTLSFHTQYLVLFTPNTLYFSHPIHPLILLSCAVAFAPVCRSFYRRLLTPTAMWPPPHT